LRFLDPAFWVLDDWESGEVEKDPRFGLPPNCINRKMLRIPNPKKKVTSATMLPIRIAKGAAISSRKTDTKMTAIQYNGIVTPGCSIWRWE
jgi:hypothetical protein